MCSLWFKKKRVYFRPLTLSRVYSNRFLRNHTEKVVPRVFPSCWKLLAFDRIQLDACCATLWRRFEATLKLRPMIPIFERNEITECPRKPRQPTSVGITWHIQPFSTKSARSVSYLFFFLCFLFNLSRYVFAYAHWNRVSFAITSSLPLPYTAE